MPTWYLGNNQPKNGHGLRWGLALDLWVEFGGGQHVIEVKLRRDTDTEEDTYEQVLRYLDHVGMEEGWLVLFDLRKTLTWKEKLFIRDESFEGKTIHVVGA